MDRDLDDIRREAQAETQSGPDIEPYVVRVDGHRVIIRNPSDIPAKEAEAARPGLSGQLRLLTSTGSDYRRLWNKVGKWTQNEITALVDNIIEHYQDQESGKGRSSTSSGDTPAK